VKLDIGVHLDGYIADTACTVDLGDQPLLCEASIKARDAAIEAVKPGVAIGTLGGIVAQEIKSRGFLPVANLTGHGLDQYCLHKGPNVPNIPGTGGAVLEEGMVIAIEPFASTGTGFVHDGSRVEIFSQLVKRPVRLPAARKILKDIEGLNGLPFARRHIKVKSADLALARLVNDGIIRAYPVLSDVSGSFVSQAEHTMIVTGDGCIVTTA
jgi:methionyl aminopeptidase